MSLFAAHLRSPQFSHSFAESEAGGERHSLRITDGDDFFHFTMTPAAMNRLFHTINPDPYELLRRNDIDTEVLRRAHEDELKASRCFDCGGDLDGDTLDREHRCDTCQRLAERSA